METLHDLTFVEFVHAVRCFASGAPRLPLLCFAKRCSLVSILVITSRLDGLVPLRWVDTAFPFLLASLAVNVLRKLLL